MADWSNQNPINTNQGGDTVYQGFVKAENNFNDIYDKLNILKKAQSGIVPPDSPTVGELWFDENTGILKRFDGTDWIEIVAVKDLSNVDDSVILEKLKKVDGSSSGLDADLLDGKETATSPTASAIPVTDSNGYLNVFVKQGSGSGFDADKVDSFDASQSPSANQIPVLDSSGVLNLPFSPPYIKIAGQDLMNRTFYVDAVNGDDNNDGSSSAPFKTLQKAVDSIPIGGFGYINLVSDYTGVFSSHFKIVYININSGKVWTIPMGSVCFIAGSSITIFNQGKLVIDRGDGSDVSGDNYAGFFVNNWEKVVNLEVVTNLYLVNYQTANPVRIDSDRCLFGSRYFGLNQNIQMNLAILNIYCSDNFTLDGYLLALNHGCGSFQWNNYGNDDSFQIVDSNGNIIDVKTKIMGVIKDSNGIPRNIMSNLIL